MYLDEIVDPFFGFRVACSQMRADEAETGLKDPHPKDDCAFVAELSAHTGFNSILLD